MRISIGQLLTVLIICILLFGDLPGIKKKLFLFINQLKNHFSKK